MNVLLTGASGFLGNYIANNLRELNHKLIQLGRNYKSDIICDLTLQVPKLEDEIDMVIHAAGKAHFNPITEEEKQSFFNISIQGSRNLCLALEKTQIPKTFVFISSVAVYGKESGILINENENLSAKDPYGQSKIQAEKLVQEWCDKYNVICTILRLPLVAGSNPPGNLKSMITGIYKGFYFNIDGGKAKKSIVFAKDVAKIIPIAAEIGGTYNLTDGYHPSFAELSELIAIQLGKRKPSNIPNWLADIMAKGGDLLGPKSLINSVKLKKITSSLTFDDSKARKAFGWSPSLVLESFKI